MRATARSNASDVRSVGACTPLTLRAYWRAAAVTSSAVAGGSRPRSVVMLRHMGGTLEAALRNAAASGSSPPYRAPVTAEPASERTTVKRKRQRGVYERAAIEEILDECLICHVGFVADGQPVVLPTVHARRGDMLYLHGAVANRMLTTAASGAALSVSATIVDGLVLARSAMHQSINYRSVVVFGTGRDVVDTGEKLAALRALVDHVVPGRFDQVRGPTETELRATRVVAIALDEASAKVRSGPPVDDDEDLVLRVWAGVIPLRVAAGTSMPAPDLDPGIGVPAHVTRLAEVLR